MNLERIIILVCLGIMIALGATLGIKSCSHKEKAAQLRAEVRKWKSTVDTYLHTPPKVDTVYLSLSGINDSVYRPKPSNADAKPPVVVPGTSFDSTETLYSQIITTKDFKAHVSVGTFGKLSFVAIPDYVITVPSKIITLPPIRIDSLIYDTIEVLKSHFGVFGGVTGKSLTFFPGVEVGAFYEFKSRWGIEAGVLLMNKTFHGTLRARFTIL